MTSPRSVAGVLMYGAAMVAAVQSVDLRFMRGRYPAKVSNGEVDVSLEMWVKSRHCCFGKDVNID